MDVMVTDRDINLTTQSVISTQDDTGTQTVTFKFLKSSIEYDVMELNAFVLYRTGSAGVRFEVCAKTETTETVDSVSTTYVNVIWTVNKPVAATSGNLEVQIVFTDTANPVTNVSEHRWSTTVCVVNVPRTLAHERYAVTTEPIILQMTNLASSAVDASEDAADYANSAAASATLAQSSAASVTAAVQNALGTLMGNIYPIGSIFITTNANTNPASVFTGTTWTRIKDRFLLAAGDTYSAGATGGSATVNLSHVHGALNATNGSLEAMIGSGWGDSGSIAFRQSNVNNRVIGTYKVNGKSSITPTTVNSHNTEVRGATASAGSSSQSILPPYLAVYVWQRTA